VNGDLGSYEAVPTRAAASARLAVKQLTHAVHCRERGVDLGSPADVYLILGQMKLLTAHLGDVLEQLRRWLEEELVDGNIAVCDERFVRNPCGAVLRASKALAAAVDAELDAQLAMQDAQTASAAIVGPS